MPRVVESIIIVLMLALNAVFASYEMAIAAVSRSRLLLLEQAGRRGARQAVYMKDRLEGSLAVIQLGITLAGAVAAATGGAGVEEWLAPHLVRHFGFSASVSEFLALALFVVPLSCLTIVFAELVPKMVGIRNKEAVVLVLSPAMKGVAHVFRPVVFVFEAIVKRVVGTAQAGERGGRPADEDQGGLMELRAAVALARATRVIGPLEEHIVNSAVQLSNRTVAEAMAPAADIAMIPSGMGMMDALLEAHLHMHTRYPVCTEPGNPDSISGYVTFKDIVTSLKMDPRGSGLRGIVRPIRRLDRGVSLAQALSEMMRDRIHIALVADGGRVLGLVTMEDIVEELVGDIHDEYDRLPAHVHAVGDAWLVGGGVQMGDLLDAVGTAWPTGVERAMTLSDWLARGDAAALVRGGSTLRRDGLVIQVRKVRRNRVTEAVVRRDGPRAPAVQ